AGDADVRQQLGEPADPDAAQLRDDAEPPADLVDLETVHPDDDAGMQRAVVLEDHARQHDRPGADPNAGTDRHTERRDRRAGVDRGARIDPRLLALQLALALAHAL